MHPHPSLVVSTLCMDLSILVPAKHSRGVIDSFFVFSLVQIFAQPLEEKNVPTKFQRYFF